MMRLKGGIALIVFFATVLVAVFLFLSRPDAADALGIILILFLAGFFLWYRQRRANFDMTVEVEAAREWRQTFDAITDFVSIHEADFKILQVNKTLADAFHKKPEDFVGMACHELFHGTQEAIDGCPHRKTIATGKPAREEFYNDHLKCWLEVSTSPVFDAKGKVARTVHIAKDISSRKKAEEKVQRLTKLLDDIIQNAPLGMYVVDKTGHIEYTNKAMLKMAGTTPDQSNKLNVFTYEPYVKLGLAEKIQGVLRGEPFRMENITFESIFSGRVTSRNMSGIPMPGETDKALIISEDVTFKKDIEKIQRLAELGRFVGDTAHFIDNPLMVIMGSAEMALMEGAKPDEVRESLAIIVRECERAKNIIQGLHQFAQPEKRQAEPEDIHKILDEVATSSGSQWQQEGFEIRTSWDKSVPTLMVNSEQIKRAILHLLLNAREAMPSGGIIEIRTAVENFRVRIDIKDSGKGMSEKTLEHIFDPFYSTKDGKPGLGVSVAYGILREHGGDLKYVSHVGAGTIASAYLPITQPRH